MRNSQYRAYRVLDARANHARSVIYPFRTFTISCNKLHATILNIKKIPKSSGFFYSQPNGLSDKQKTSP